jgi:hypothetical protein
MTDKSVEAAREQIHWLFDGNKGLLHGKAMIAIVRWAHLRLGWRSCTTCLENVRLRPVSVLSRARWWQPHCRFMTGASILSGSIRATGKEDCATRGQQTGANIGFLIKHWTIKPANAVGIVSSRILEGCTPFTGTLILAIWPLPHPLMEGRTGKDRDTSANSAGTLTGVPMLAEAWRLGIREIKWFWVPWCGQGKRSEADYIISGPATRAKRGRHRNGWATGKPHSCQIVWPA